MARKRINPLSEAVDKQLYLLGMTRTDLADEVGVTYQYMSNILSGRIVLPINMSRKIGRVIDIEDDTLRKLALGDKQQVTAM